MDSTTSLEEDSERDLTAVSSDAVVKATDCGVVV